MTTEGTSTDNPSISSDAAPKPGKGREVASLVALYCALVGALLCIIGALLNLFAMYYGAPQRIAVIFITILFGAIVASVEYPAFRFCCCCLITKGNAENISLQMKAKYKRSVIYLIFAIILILFSYTLPPFLGALLILVAAIIRMIMDCRNINQTSMV